MDGQPFLNHMTIEPIIEKDCDTNHYFLGIIRSCSFTPTRPHTQYLAPPPQAYIDYPQNCSMLLMGQPAGLVPFEGHSRADVRIPTHFEEALLQFEVPYPQMITKRQPPFNILYVNSAWCHCLQCTIEDLIGKPYNVIYASELETNSRQSIERALQVGNQVLAQPYLYSCMYTKRCSSPAFS